MSAPAVDLVARNAIAATRMVVDQIDRKVDNQYLDLGEKVDLLIRRSSRAAFWTKILVGGGIVQHCLERGYLEQLGQLVAAAARAALRGL